MLLFGVAKQSLYKSFFVDVPETKVSIPRLDPCLQNPVIAPPLPLPVTSLPVMAPPPEDESEPKAEPEWTEEEKRQFISSLKPYTPMLKPPELRYITITDVQCHGTPITVKEYMSEEALKTKTEDVVNVATD